MIDINSPSPIYMIPQKCIEKACSALKLCATIPAVGAVKTTGNIGNIHAGVMCAAFKLCRFVKSTKYISNANKYAIGAYIQNITLSVADSLLPSFGLAKTCAPWIMEEMHIMTMEKKCASESLVIDRRKTPRLVKRRMVMNVPIITNSVTPMR
jgi:hypothetical protein